MSRAFVRINRLVDAAQQLTSGARFAVRMAAVAIDPDAQDRSFH